MARFECGVLRGMHVSTALPPTTTALPRCNSTKRALSAEAATGESRCGICERALWCASCLVRPKLCGGWRLRMKRRLFWQCEPQGLLWRFVALDLLCIVDADNLREGIIIFSTTRSAERILSSPFVVAVPRLREIDCQLRPVIGTRTGPARPARYSYG